jgi:hypothetical protein
MAIGGTMRRQLKETTLAAVLGVSVAALVSISASLADDKPWDATPKRKCSEVITSDGNFTPQTASALTWLVGYMDGLRAASILDKRLVGHVIAFDGIF